MLKKSLYTIINVVVINVILIFAHIIAFFGLAFNDSSAEFPSVLHLLPNMIVCIGPLAVGSYFLIRVFSKMLECYKPVLYVIQGLLVVCYMITYINSYVPNSMVRKAIDFVEESRAEREQEKRNQEALEYLSDKRVEVYDEIGNGEDRITIYICHDSEKVVFRYCDDTTEQVGYCTADVNYFEGPEPDSMVKYRKLDTGNAIILETVDLAYLEIDENRYLCLNRQELGVYCEEYKHVCFLYFELLNQDIIENNLRYLPDDTIALEIEEDDMVYRITEESIRQLSTTDEAECYGYRWLVLRDGWIVLDERVREGEYTLNLRELPEDIWKQEGSYKIYLRTRFYSKLPGTEYSGYIKASNSITWEISE